jgi:hypothetical protein
VTCRQCFKRIFLVLRGQASVLPVAFEKKRAGKRGQSSRTSGKTGEPDDAGLTSLSSTGIGHEHLLLDPFVPAFTLHGT